MKVKIIFTLIASCLLMTAAIFFSFTERVLGSLTDREAVWAVSALVSSVFFLSVLILSIVSYMGRLTAKSYELINTSKEHNNSLWFGNEMALERNYSLIKRKFELSADYIASIGHYDSLGTMDDLVKNDSIGIALVKISQEILALKTEEDKRNWITQGLGKFNEIHRNKPELKEYTHQILSQLVKYMGASQGSLFIEYENALDGRFLELTACYAYEKRKYVESKVFEGQGLLGQCMLERDFIFLADVPNNYLKITSGLGEAAARNIVVAPLIFNDKFYGVIELASFHLMQPHHIEFLKKVCENIASEIASIKTFQHTEHLLNESTTLTQELQESQEEMKQNLEELAATQEEMDRKQSELNSYMAAIDNTIASAEFDLLGNFVNGNQIFLTITGYSGTDIKGTNYKQLMSAHVGVEMMWENLKVGKFFSGEFKIRNKEGEELWLNGTFNPIILKDGKPEKVMMFAQFTTHEKERLNDLSVMVNALKSTLPVLEFNDQFVCKTANEKFLKIFGLTKVTLRNKTIHDFINASYWDIFDSLKPEILNKDFTSILLPMHNAENICTYEASISVARKLDGRISRIILILMKESDISMPILIPVSANNYMGNQ